MPNQNICIEVLDNVDVSNNCIITKETEMSSQVDLFDTDTFVAKQVDYQENYLMSDLKKIAEYYDISVRKLKKEELIQEIVLFEINPDNSQTYLKRLQAWYWLKELKEDSKLKQYILF